MSNLEHDIRKDLYGDRLDAVMEVHDDEADGKFRTMVKNIIKFDGTDYLANLIIDSLKSDELSKFHKAVMKADK